MKNQNENPAGKEHASKSQIVDPLKGESIGVPLNGLDNLIEKYTSVCEMLKRRIINLETTTENIINPFVKKDFIDVISELNNELITYEAVLKDFKSLKKQS